MDEKQKNSSNGQNPRRGLTRKERMRRLQKRKRAKRRKMIAISIFTVAAIAVLIAMVLIIKSLFSPDELKGTWSLDEATSYQFDGKENGAMLVSESEYKFTYDIKRKNLLIDYESDILVDGEYEFKVKKDVLILIGGEGTSGDTYELTKID